MFYFVSWYKDSIDDAMQKGNFFTALGCGAKAYPVGARMREMPPGSLVILASARTRDDGDDVYKGYAVVRVENPIERALGLILAKVIWPNSGYQATNESIPLVVRPEGVELDKNLWKPLGKTFNRTIYEMEQGDFEAAITCF